MRLLSVVFVCVTGLLVADPAEAKPTRSECIVGFSMDWSKVETDPGYVVREMLDKWTMYKFRPLAAVMLSQGLSRMYLQYAADCDQKREMVEELVAYWRAKRLDLPQLTPIDEPIVPSPDTIDVHGPSWVD